jgi:hypothetical protein
MLVRYCGSGFAWIRIILSDPDLHLQIMDPDSDPICEVTYIGNTGTKKKTLG